MYIYIYNYLLRRLKWVEGSNYLHMVGDQKNVLYLT